MKSFTQFVEEKLKSPYPSPEVGQLTVDKGKTASPAVLKDPKSFPDIGKGSPVNAFPSKCLPQQTASGGGKVKPLGSLASNGMATGLEPNALAPDSVNESHSHGDEQPSMKTHLGEIFTPSLHEVTKYISHIINKDPKVAERLFRDMKRTGGHKHLIKESLNHPETFTEIVAHIGGEGGEKHAKKFVSALNSHHSDYLAKHAKLEESVSPPLGGPTAMPAADTMGSMTSFPTPSAGPSPTGGSGEGMGGGGGTMGYGGTDGYPQVPSFGGGPSGSPAGNFGGYNASAQAMPSDSMPPKENENTGPKLNMSGQPHDHIVSEMAKYPQMMESMERECNGM